MKFTAMLVMYCDSGIFKEVEGDYGRTPERKAAREIVLSYGKTNKQLKVKEIKCTACGETKFAPDFRRLYNAVGYHSTCRECEDSQK